MRGINKVLILGNLGHEPEIRTTTNGRQVCTLRIATQRSVRTDDGWEETPEWHRVECWESDANVASRFLQKGNGVAIEGHLSTSHWTDAEGKKCSRTQVVCDRLTLLPRTPAQP